MDILEDPSPFFAHAARVRADFLGLTLSEADTRTHLIDPVVAMLGYTGLADVRREERIAATREAVDYVLLIDGQRHAIIEAKGVQHDITAGHAAQCVQYATVLGVRWCMITNGVIWALYDAHLDGSLKDKHVATGRLDQDDVETTADAWHVICVLARDPAVADRARRSMLIESEIGAQLSEPDSPRHSGTSTRRQKAIRRGRPAGRDCRCDRGLASQSRDGGRKSCGSAPRRARPTRGARTSAAALRVRPNHAQRSRRRRASPPRRGTGTPAPGQSPRRATPRRAHRIRGAALDTRAGGLRRPGAPAQRLAVLAL